MKKFCYLRFYDRLKSISNKERCIFYFNGKPAIIDIVESLGVPHTEVYLILKNQTIVSMYDWVYPGDFISVFPRMHTLFFDLYKQVLLDPAYPKKIKKEFWNRYQNYRIRQFVADVHLGKLVKYLRFLGVDVLYNPSWDDDELIEISVSNKRILLTQDKGILKNKRVQHGFYIIHRDPEKQLEEFLNYFQIDFKPFTRCSLCNDLLIPITKQDLDNFPIEIPESIKQSYSEFCYCKSCYKVYWEGSHYERLSSFFNKIFGNTT
jgi:uncharacterized protein with PIN domain